MIVFLLFENKRVMGCMDSTSRNRDRQELPSSRRNSSKPKDRKER